MISQRIVRNKNGQVFIPMNIDGGVLEDNFITSVKVAVLIILGFAFFISWVWVLGWDTGWVAKFLAFIVILYLVTLVIRKFVMEEDYFLKIYRRMKNYEITTPAVFWDIVNIKENDDGTVVIYSDFKIGVILKLFRDSVIGRSEDFKERHYDSISEFYKELNLRGYRVIQMNIMEAAGKDDRVNVLDNLIAKCSNENLKKLIEVQVNYIKSITKSTLIERDYFLIYTEDVNKSDIIISDVTDSAVNLLGGAYSGYRLLNLDEIIELVKDIYGVKYFDCSEAVLNVFRSNILNEPFKVVGLVTSDNETLEISEADLKKIIAGEKLEFLKKSSSNREFLDGAELLEDTKILKGVETLEEADILESVETLEGDDALFDNEFFDNGLLENDKFSKDNKFLDGAGLSKNEKTSRNIRHSKKEKEKYIFGFNDILEKLELLEKLKSSEKYVEDTSISGIQAEVDKEHYHLNDIVKFKTNDTDFKDRDLKNRGQNHDEDDEIIDI